MYVLREEPEDFRVDEIPLYAPAGHGDHTFVRVQKRLRTTEQVARDLARAAGVSPRDVGYAGRKDRIAVATQWLSVPGLAPERARDLDLPGATVLEAAAHPHKLRTGHVRANRFALRLRGVATDAWRAGSERLARASRLGFANRFGPQRFGRDGDNPEQALRLLRDGVPRGRRREARFLLSALQARIFNAVLDARPLPLDRLETGDVAVRHESGGQFRVEDAAAEQPRADAFEISPTGPILGSKMTRPAGAVAAREAEIARCEGVDPDQPFRAAGVSLRGARRALRIRPEDVSHEHRDETLLLRFTLPSGSYATVLVEELLGAAAGDSSDAAAERGVS
ncbi:MAG: tRNA pseudouridine(13) synthase TruD [Myxococcota bacterium]